MLIKSLRLHNIRSYLSEEIRFPEGSLLLSGDIGSGKSTILMAVEFALFGTVRGAEGASLLRRGKNSGYVELRFGLDGKDVAIRRNLKRSRDSVSQAPGYLAIDGVKADFTALELKARVLDLLEYPKNLLTRSKSLIYRYTVYTPQEDMKRILFEDSAWRLDTLRKVFQIDKYRTVRENAGIVSRGLKERIAELSGRTEGMPQKKSQLGELSSSRRAAQARMENLLPLLKSVGESLNLQRELLGEIEGRVRTANKLRADVAAMDASVREKERSVASMKGQRESSLAEIARIEAMLADESELAGFQKNLSCLNHHVSVLGSETSEKQELASGIEGLRGEINRLTGDVSREQAAVSNSEKLERNVLGSDTCPVCLQGIAEEHKARFRKEISDEKTRAFAAIDEKSGRMKEAGRSLESANEKMEVILSKEREVAELQALFSRYSAEAVEHGIVPAPYDGREYDSSSLVRSLESSCRALRGRSESRSALDARRAGIELIGKRIAEVDAEKAEAAGKSSEVRARLQQFSGADSEMASARENFESLRDRERELLVKKASAEAEIRNIDVSMRALAVEIAEMEKAGKMLDHSRQLRNWLEEFFVKTVDVMERTVMLNVHAEFNSLFRSWFDVLMEDESVSARLDDSFSPVVEINGYESPLENLSGGEKSGCALAYRLALNRVINDVSSFVRTRDLLILDEPTDGFSSQQLEKIRDVLEQLGVRQTVIVSHEQKIESFVKSVIAVSKENHVSRAVPQGF